MDGTGRDGELSMNTPQVADSYVPSRLVPGGTENRVGIVSHRLQLTPKARCPGEAWVLVLEASSERPLAPVTSLCNFRNSCLPSSQFVLQNRGSRPSRSASSPFRWKM